MIPLVVMNLIFDDGQSSPMSSVDESLNLLTQLSFNGINMGETKTLSLKFCGNVNCCRDTRVWE